MVHVLTFASVIATSFACSGSTVVPDAPPAASEAAPDAGLASEAGATAAPPALEVIVTSRPALASRPAVGRVAVTASTLLASTEEGARAEVGAPFTRAEHFQLGRGQLRSVGVVRDSGDVVALETADVEEDCLPGLGLGYRLRVFVARSKLIPRATRAIEKLHPDGSGWLADVGAPMLPLADGGWRAGPPLLRSAGASVPEEAMALGITPPPHAGTLADVGAPASCTDAHAVESNRKRRASASVLDFQGHSYLPEQHSCEVLASDTMLTVGDRPVISAHAVQPLRHAVKRVDERYLVTVATTCGLVRAIAPEAAVGVRLFSRIHQRPSGWVARAGAEVTWPDGRPAGVALGTHHFTDADLTREANRVCARLPWVDAPVCHDAADLLRVGR
ncbi:MAG: hypothetical protein IT385_25645 [Deltaproteobacteria bacterium]|nr:hypothetical protein [Deltaproteobacteria bacterium]